LHFNVILTFIDYTNFMKNKSYKVSLTHFNLKFYDLDNNPFFHEDWLPENKEKTLKTLRNIIKEFKQDFDSRDYNLNTDYEFSLGKYFSGEAGNQTIGVGISPFFGVEESKNIIKPILHHEETHVIFRDNKNNGKWDENFIYFTEYLARVNTEISHPGSDHAYYSSVLRSAAILEEETNFLNIASDGYCETPSYFQVKYASENKVFHELLEEIKQDAKSPKFSSWEKFVRETEKYNKTISENPLLFTK